MILPVKLTMSCPDHLPAPGLPAQQQPEQKLILNLVSWHNSFFKFFTRIIHYKFPSAELHHENY